MKGIENVVVCVFLCGYRGQECCLITYWIPKANKFWDGFIWDGIRKQWRKTWIDNLQSGSNSFGRRVIKIRAEVWNKLPLLPEALVENRP